MSNLSKISKSDEILRQASQWVVMLDEGLSQQERAELGKWLSESSSNRSAFMKTAKVWDKTEVLSELSELFPQPANRFSSWQWAFSVVTALVILAVGPLIWWVYIGELSPADVEISGNDSAGNQFKALYDTEVGEYLEVSLPDGTEILLNTNSVVSVVYTDQQRYLFLEQGEIHLDVARDKTRPLSIAAGSTIVQALGTAFNIELRGDQGVELVVTEGAVLVGEYSQANRVPGPLVPVVLPPGSIAVAEGQQVLLNAGENELEKIAPSEIAIKLSWRERQLIFKGESLEYAISEISRYTPVEFVIQDDEIKTTEVFGLFETGDVDGLLVDLQRNFDISYKRTGQKIFLSTI